MDNRLNHVYLVGGAVRDRLLSIDSQDNDYVVVGETVSSMEAFGFHSVGNDFPVFLHPKTKEEYALARTERKSSMGYTGFTVHTNNTVTLEEDLARRDLTINSMALDANGTIIDPFNGQGDLNKKILRHTSQAFVEDPVRVLRIARFLARYGDEWQIYPDTRLLMEDLRDKGELANLVPDRVWKETEKALNERYPHLYFMALNGLGIFPEIESMVGIPQPPIHHPEGDVYIHTMLTLKRAADLAFDTETRFAALTHDFGKAQCYQKRGNLHGHEQVGVNIINAFCNRLRIPNRFKTLAKLTSDNHTRCHKITELTSETLHKLLIKNLSAVQNQERFTQFINTCLCDAQGRGETFVNRLYPQAEFAHAALQELIALDRKVIVKRAIEQGKKGVDISLAIHNAEIQILRTFVTTYKQKN